LQRRGARQLTETVRFIRVRGLIRKTLREATAT
jgi:hypothetical protein